ncbi:hypothetical protein [Paenibacillus elgii]|uniref:hypothetical protein n=1 Tax=Paenibacillus elgii TaxID=189691 RepID=UPI0013D0983E|nr:hypothetical protein [Paenibacillus elgii]
MKKRAISILCITALVFGLTACNVEKTNEKNIENLNKNMNNLQYGMYNNALVSGGQISQAVDLYGQSVSIIVHTGINKEGFYVKTSNCFVIKEEIAIEGKNCPMVPVSKITEDTTENQPFHVNPTGAFNSKLYKDKKGEVRIIEFTQNINGH